MRDGSPEATLVWIETDGTYMYFNTAMHRLKARNLQRDPRVAIVVYDCNEPYSEVLAIKGRVEMILEGADEHIDKHSRLYEGKPFGFRPPAPRVFVTATPHRFPSPGGRGHDDRHVLLHHLHADAIQDTY